MGQPEESPGPVQTPKPLENAAGQAALHPMLQRPEVAPPTLSSEGAGPTPDIMSMLKDALGKHDQEHVDNQNGLKPRRYVNY